ncbi:MAG: hypothetical protein H6708_17400 [Kofleriaceae bacterium]|nr:hypothetical protein [Myxococcales bacterium]MCB9562183.1 hypothetical protein [Kofleriaceae bacterium]
MSLADVPLVDLTVWLHERCEQPTDEFAASLAAEIAARGGEAPASEVRAWLEKRLAERERSGRRHATDGHDFARTAPCGCGRATNQLRHGFTSTGGMWKGHACACRGWQCSECGRIVSRQGSCCR